MYDRVLFIVLIFLTAYLLKSISVFREEDSKHFINYVLYFSLPALVVKEIHSIKLDTDSLGVVLLAWGVILSSALTAFVLGRFFGFEGASLRTMVLVSSFGNTAFMGYPFTFAFFGDAGLGYAVLYDQLGSFMLVVSLGIFIATGRFSTKEILTFPPFWALVAGLSLRGVDIPEVLSVFLEVCGKSLIPVVLFAIGLRFSVRGTLSSLKGGILALLIKMLLAPLGVLVVIKLLSLEGIAYEVALLESAMPPMVMAGVLAVRYGLDDKLAICAITLGMLLSFITAPLFISMV